MHDVEHITDEMLTRYLCGTASNEEQRQVEDYLAENDGRIDDLLAIVAAAEQTVDSASRERTAPHRRTVVRPLWLAVAAVACVALLVWGGRSIMQPAGQLKTNPAPTYAEMDTIVDGMDSIVELETDCSL